MERAREIYRESETERYRERLTEREIVNDRQ